MGNVNRGLIGVLLATVVVFALWLVALKPSSNSNTGGTPSKPALGRFQSDINAAKGVQTTVNKASAAATGDTTAAGASTAAARASTTATTSSTTPASTSTKTSHKAKTAAHTRSHAKAHAVKLPSLATPTARLSAVQNALRSHKVLALLFYNPAAPDDGAVKQELQTISTHRGAVVKLAIPLTEIPSYTAVISQVPVNFSPTLVIIDRAQQAQEITGFTDSFEISVRLDEALASGTTAG